jgi:hypothetical protein
MGNLIRKREERDVSVFYIEMSLKDIGYKGVEQIHVAKFGNQWPRIF